MVDVLMDGISIALNRAFGDGYQVYGDEDIRQGLEEPCFFIAAISLARTPKLGKRALAENSFDVHYFPDKKGSNKEMHAVGDQLFDVLEYITLANGDLLRGARMRYQVTEGVLHFFVHYNLFLAKVRQEDSMEGVQIQTGLGEEG